MSRERIENKYGKRYFEEYAILSLVMCYDRRLQSLLEAEFHAESPDFQDFCINLGIEVTRAETKRYGEYSAVINHYFGKGNKPEFIQQEIKRRFPKFSDNIFIDGDTFAFYEECDTKAIIIDLKKSISEKLQKLNSGYKVFEQNWLYIFSGTSVLNEEDMNLMNKETKSYQIQFNKIFVNCFDRIYILENYELIQTVFLSNEELIQIKKKAFKRVGNSPK